MTTALHLIGFGVLGMVLWMGLLWRIYRRMQNAGIVDFGWASGLAGLGFLYALRGPGTLLRREIMGGMVLFWGLRLAAHVWFDRVLGKPEDPRYLSFRQKWKTSVDLKFFFFFEFQALLDVFLSLPFLWMAMNPEPTISIWEWVGLFIWAVAVVGEWVADHQLKRFKSNSANKGKTCRIGLWNYSRHPNYFFEWVIWIAYFVAALPSPLGWTSIGSPVLMYYFLRYVTGIPLTEEHAVKTRGDDYKEYQRTTSAFVPWFKSA